MTEQQTSVPLLSRLRPPVGAVRPKKRKGRGPGSGLGKTAGKGQKGQKARHPGNFGKLGFEGGQMPLQRRLPKVGFWRDNSDQPQVINVKALERFQANQAIDIELLKKVGLVRKSSVSKIKLLAEGEVSKALTVRVHAASAAAIQKIEAQGGCVEILS